MVAMAPWWWTAAMVIVVMVTTDMVMVDNGFGDGAPASGWPGEGAVGLGGHSD